MRKNLFFILCFVSFTASLNGNNPFETFHHLTSRDGLSHNSIKCILKDSEGFMWFGTNDGLNRYDGYGYTCFKPTTDPYSINHNTINCIAEDRNGNLWIGSENGLHEYIYTTGDFKNYIIRDESSVGNNPVKDILEDKEGMLWISTGSFNFYKFNPLFSLFQIVVFISL